MAMITKRHIITMMMGCILGTIGHVCWAEDTIHWFTINYPPAYFVDGHRQGEGFCDVAGERFRHALTAYNHTMINGVSQPRMLKFWEKTDATYCVPGLGVTIGQFPHTVYSKTMTVVPSVGVMIRKAERNRFATSNEQHASIKQLLHDETLVCGAFTDGQYTEQIDAIIKKYNGKPQFCEIPKIDNIALFKMLANKRVDYVLTWSFAVKITLDALHPEERDSLIFLPLIEADASHAVYAVCNDTLLGRQVIEQINQILTTETYKSVITERLLEFLPENIHDEYQALNVQYIGR